MVLREFLLTDSAGTRTVRHYNFLSWPDHHVPESPEPLMELLNLVTSDPLYTAPPLVHCSAGVGRTGTFCVIDTILRLAKTTNPGLLRPGHELDPVLNITIAFREQRISIVETFVRRVCCAVVAHPCLVPVLLHLPVHHVLPRQAQGSGRGINSDGQGGSRFRLGTAAL